MKILKLALNGFRNYEWETAKLSEHTNVICGDNAQGKTNLLEAVYLLSGGRSFRTRSDREMVGFDYSEAEILAEVFSHDREQTIRIRLCPGQAKKITVNGVRKTGSELAGTVNVVLFCPDDLNLIKDGAQVRRKMLDLAISQIRPKYAALVTEFNRLYEVEWKWIGGTGENMKAFDYDWFTAMEGGRRIDTTRPWQRFDEEAVWEDAAELRTITADVARAALYEEEEPSAVKGIDYSAREDLSS